MFKSHLASQITQRNWYVLLGYSRCTIIYPYFAGSTEGIGIFTLPPQRTAQVLHVWSEAAVGPPVISPLFTIYPAENEQWNITPKTCHLQLASDLPNPVLEPFCDTIARQVVSVPF
jgi:hypothetical protein